MGWLKTGSTERDMLITWRPEDRTISSMSRRLWEGVKCGLWDWTSKVNNNWKIGGMGLTGGFGQRLASLGWDWVWAAGSLCWRSPTETKGMGWWRYPVV